VGDIGYNTSSSRADSRGVRVSNGNAKAMADLWELYLGYEGTERLCKAVADHECVRCIERNQLLLAAPHLVEYGRTAWSKSCSNVLLERSRCCEDTQSTTAIEAEARGAAAADLENGLGQNCAQEAAVRGLGVSSGTIDWAAVHARLAVKIREGASVGRGSLNAALEAARSWATLYKGRHCTAQGSLPLHPSKQQQQQWQQEDTLEEEGSREGVSLGMALCQGAVELFQSPPDDMPDVLLCHLSLCTEAIIQQIMVEAER
jgi:hypothetical protein